MHEVAQRVLKHIRRQELLRAGDRLGLAVSGGIDSVALLRLLLELRKELGIVLSVVHFNHQLRGAESDADQKFVAGLAQEHGLEFHCESGDVAAVAARGHSGVEAAAREMRYEFFGQLLGADGESHAEATQRLKPTSLVNIGGSADAAPFQSHSATQHQSISALDKIATGHTLDDQAETVLMRVVRGTGLRGLAAIYPRIVIDHGIEHEDEGHHAEIVRPLLGIRRRDLQQYLTEIKQPWREDSSNSDAKFTRNRVRNLVLPLLEREFNPAVVESFAELAEIARDEEDYWENEISGWLGTVVQWSEPDWTRDLQDVSFVQIEPAGGGSPHCSPMDLGLRSRIEEAPWLVMNASVSRPWLLTEPKAVQRRVLKAIGEQAGIPLEFKHIEDILRFAEEHGPSGKILSLPLGWKIVREVEDMAFLTPDLRQQQRIPDYEYVLAVPGRVIVPELGIVIEALQVTPGSEIAEYNPQQLLRAEASRGPLIVRNWRAGERFWPAHTKAAKKIKELLRDQYASRQIGQQVRRLWPVVANGDQIVWMRGFRIPASLQAEVGENAVLIREIPFGED